MTAIFPSSNPRYIEKEIQTSIPNSPKKMSRGVSPHHSPQNQRKVHFSPQRLPKMASFGTQTPTKTHNIHEIHPQFSPIILVQNPQENIQIPRVLEKVIIDNPDAYDPVEARENHDLRQLKEINIPNPELRKKRLCL